jgi:hypothetical protein
MTWTDTTRYSRNDTVRTPAVWEITVPGACIIVHRWQGPDGWYGTCRELGEDKRPLTATTLEAAQQEFLTHLTDKTKKLVIAMKTAATAHHASWLAKKKTP